MGEGVGGTLLEGVLEGLEVGGCWEADVGVGWGDATADHQQLHTRKHLFEGARFTQQPEIGPKWKRTINP